MYGVFSYVLIILILILCTFEIRVLYIIIIIYLYYIKYSVCGIPLWPSNIYINIIFLKYININCLGYL